MEMIRIETDARGVARLTLARADKHNAMNAQMIAELDQAADVLATDDAVRVVVLAADGPTFCAGGDLGWMRAQIAADDVARRAGAAALAGMLFKLNTLPKPMIAAVHGNSFGGGVGLISVCDVAICADSVQFGLTETRLGLIPATIGPYVIARLGEAKARRVFMSSARFDTTRARDLGLAAEVVPAGELEQAVEAEVIPYLSCAPGAVAAAKALARKLGPAIGPAEITASIDALIAQWAGDEAPEGIAAFFEKRPAAWVV